MMTFSRFATRVSLLCAIVAFSNAARADTLIDNLAEPVRDTTTIDNALWGCQGFNTDSLTYTLDSITIIAGDMVGFPTPVAELRASTPDNHPDTSAEGLLCTLTVPDLSGALGEVNLSPDQAVLLEPNTRYFLVMGASGEGSFGWSYADTNNWLGNGSFANYEYSTDMGATWFDFGNDFPYFMRVDATLYNLSETVNPLSYMVTSGFEFMGDLTSLLASDDDCLGIFPDEVSLVAQVLFDSATTIIDPIQLTFTIETFVGREGLSQEVKLYDFDALVMTSVDGRIAPTTDTTISVTFTGEAPAYVGSSGELQAEVTWQPINDEDPAQDGWLHCVDHVEWQLSA